MYTNSPQSLWLHDGVGADVLHHIAKGYRMMSFKVVIAGGRSFSDYKLLVSKMDSLLKTKIAEGYEITIISGTANGADKLGERYAESREFQLIQMPAQWDTYGKSAGYRRNLEMADIADGIVVFWDGKSKGTKHMHDIGIRMSLPTKVVNY